MQPPTQKENPSVEPALQSSPHDPLLDLLLTSLFSRATNLGGLLPAHPAMVFCEFDVDLKGKMLGVLPLAISGPADSCGRKFVRWVKQQVREEALRCLPGQADGIDKQIDGLEPGTYMQHYHYAPFPAKRRNAAPKLWTLTVSRQNPHAMVHSFERFPVIDPSLPRWMIADDHPLLQPLPVMEQNSQMTLHSIVIRLVVKAIIRARLTETSPLWHACLLNFHSRSLNRSQYMLVPGTMATSQMEARKNMLTWLADYGLPALLEQSEDGRRLLMAGQLPFQEVCRRLQDQEDPLCLRLLQRLLSDSQVRGQAHLREVVWQ